MIPKIIHHVWPGSDPFKEKFHNFRKSWMNYHPDWTFYFWRLDNLPSDINPRIKSALLDPNYAITPKSDLLRFEVVRMFGGIYVDTDMECLKKFDNFLNDDLFSGYEDIKGTVCPSVFGAIPNHPVITQMTLTSINNAESAGYYESNKNPQRITSVEPFSNLLNKHEDKIKIKIYPKHYFFHIGYKERDRLNETHPDAYAKHYWTGKDADGWTNKINFS